MHFDINSYDDLFMHYLSDCKNEVPASCLSGIKLALEDAGSDADGLFARSNVSTFSYQFCANLYQMGKCTRGWNQVYMPRMWRNDSSVQYLCDVTTPGRVIDTCKSSCNMCNSCKLSNQTLHNPAKTHNELP